jgi:hypothetical protein
MLLHHDHRFAMRTPTSNVPAAGIRRPAVTRHLRPAIPLPAGTPALRRLVACAALLAASIQPAPAQAFAIDWYTIDGGGGRSSGGGFAVAGTIGQPDTGPAMRGGEFALVGGYWSVLAAVQTPGGPRLTIRRDGSRNVILRWPVDATGWSLEENTGLRAAGWSAAQGTPVEVDGMWQFVLPAQQGTRFYRLVRP